jgi:hypothetical protein
MRAGVWGGQMHIFMKKTLRNNGFPLFSLKSRDIQVRAF